MLKCNSTEINQKIIQVNNRPTLRRLRVNPSRKRSVIFCAFVLVTAFIQAGAQSAGPHGVVTDEFGSPVVNAILTLRNPNGTMIREAGADHHGRFFFEGLPPGSYVLTITA